MLRSAYLLYGKSRYDVIPNETLPLPKEFDFNDPVGCAKVISAIMSNASGGHRLKDIKVQYNKLLDKASVYGSGFRVSYKPSTDKKLSVDEAVAEMQTYEYADVGSVFTDQYGDGWKRAKWSDNE